MYGVEPGDDGEFEGGDQNGGSSSGVVAKKKSTADTSYFGGTGQHSAFGSGFTTERGGRISGIHLRSLSLCHELCHLICTNSAMSLHKLYQSTNIEFVIESQSLSMSRTLSSHPHKFCHSIARTLSTCTKFVMKSQTPSLCHELCHLNVYSVAVSWVL